MPSEDLFRLSINIFCAQKVVLMKPHWEKYWCRSMNLTPPYHTCVCDVCNRVAVNPIQYVTVNIVIYIILCALSVGPADVCSHMRVIAPPADRLPRDILNDGPQREMRREFSRQHVPSVIDQQLTARKPSDR
jgi:hypothetical protein